MVCWGVGTCSFNGDFKMLVFMQEADAVWTDLFNLHSFYDRPLSDDQTVDHSEAL